MPNTPLGTTPTQGTLGLNSIMVYGENLQVAVGLNHQLALGSNIQICVNPAGMLDLFPSLPLAGPIAEMLGSSMGGNMQFTIGTSANVVYGRTFDVNLGPDKIECRGGDSNVASYILCGVLGAVVLIWVIVYAEVNGDHERANETIIFQALIDGLLVALLAVEMYKNQANKEAEDIQQKLFSWSSKGKSTLTLTAQWVAGIGLSALAIGAAVAPLVAIASDENG